MPTLQRYLAQGAAALVETLPATTGGAANGGRIPALDPTTGTLDLTMMPTGVAPDVMSMPASEALAGPALVNVYVNAGTTTARNADGSTQGKPVDGYVLAPVAANGTALVYLSSGVVPGWTGLTPGDAFLSATAVGSVAASGAAAAGQTYQRVGKALSATTLQFTREPPTYRN